MSTAMSSGQSNSPVMTQSGAEIFRKAVRYILTEWPALDLAIENGMGGRQAREIRDWMCNTVSEMLLQGKDVDLNDFIGQIINQEFDTLIEDGSLEYNCQWIEKFHKDCLHGREAEVLNSINQASAKKQSLGNIRIPPAVCQTQDSSSEDGEDFDDGDDN